MNLADIQIPTADVETPGGSFAVRGLGIADFMQLVPKHLTPLNDVFKRAQSGELSVDVADMAGVAAILQQAAPNFVAEAIACASDAPEQAAKVAKLGLGVQLDALEKVATLTFAAEGGLKKVVETVIRIAQGTTGLLETVNQRT